jgi:glycosyltransferase involved in cell wall biosynthesis
MSAGTPLLSVIIPCYRGERFIAESIGSVLVQAGDAVEIVVVDDASPDASAQLVTAIDDARIRLVRHEHNRGIAAARNTGVSSSRGSLVAFLDQDDLWLPGLYDALTRVLNGDSEKRLALAFCDRLVRGPSGREWMTRDACPPRIDEMSRDELLAVLLRERFLALGAAIIRRRALLDAGPFNESIRGGSDDFDILVRLAEHGAFARVARALFVHRLHGGNFTDSEKMIDESLAVFDRVVARHPSLSGAARMGRSRRLFRRASDALMAGNGERARSDYRAAVQAWPWHARAWAGLAITSSPPLRSLVIAGWRKWCAWRLR